jgi:ribose 5-phosphate isomerase B
MKKKSALKIFIASDHAGFSLKKALLKNLSEQEFEIVDLGCDSSEISVDYPDFAQKLCKKISTKSSPKKQEFGILICGSGVGISIAANRFKHIRAALRQL